MLVRQRDGEVDEILADEVDYMDVSPRQMVSVATALIPFLEHDDANRALMGANMQRQAVPLIKSDAPLVGTGMEYRAAVDAGDVVVADEGRRGQGGVRRRRSRSMNDDGTYQTYRLAEVHAAPTRAPASTSVRWSPRVTGSRSARRSPTVPCTDEAEMALGTNLLVAFMPWQGHNYEDAIILQPAPGAGGRPHLDPHRGARGRRPRHQARPRGDHPGHPERLRGDAGRPRRARHHPHRRRGHHR